MTRRDFELIASVIAEVESEIDQDEIREPLEALENLVAKFEYKLKREHPRFDIGKFQVAALPIETRRFRARVVARLAADRNE